MTKREYVDPWDMGGLGKLWEWCANRTAGVFPYLLRKSSVKEGWGGDVGTKNSAYAGRWAGDRVYLVGDYDEGGLFESVEREYTNISEALADEYYEFIGTDTKLRPIKRVS